MRGGVRTIMTAVAAFSAFKNNYLAEMWDDSGEGSYFMAHRLFYHWTQDSRVINKKTDLRGGVRTIMAAVAPIGPP